jgi:nuclear pore complex protein Nup107
MQISRTGRSQRDGLVTEMDPNAVNRGDGAALAGDDTVSSSYLSLHQGR